jgi:alpha-1,6-mannosyltransferase
MKICDVTQFYSPRSGGVKRYVHEKIAFIQAHSPDDEHVLIVPGPRSEVISADRSRVFSVASPLVSRTTQYRAFLNLRAVDEIIEREKPDIIESADPYQLGWKVSATARAQRIPAVAFYHSHFPEAYFRGPAEKFSAAAARATMRIAESYVRRLYDRFEATLVPSPELVELLQRWGVENVRQVDLGVDTAIFTPLPNETNDTRGANGIPEDRVLLLSVGRLATEKNTQTLLEAFSLLAQRRPSVFHLLVVGDGQLREQLLATQAATGAITWLPYCADPAELAKLYRAADILVHPGTQETFGLVALESQACGTPVVGIRGSSMDRIILHDRSFWADQNTPAALADAIEQASAADLRTLARAPLRLWPNSLHGRGCSSGCFTFTARSVAAIGSRQPDEKRERIHHPQLSAVRSGGCSEPLLPDWVPW